MQTQLNSLSVKVPQTQGKEIEEGKITGKATFQEVAFLLFFIKINLI